MGSAAASAKLLSLSPSQCAHALAIAASSAGAPLANAATQTKPLHMGNAARRGLEAAQLAQLGLEGNPRILDQDCAGFGVFYRDYRPAPMAFSRDFKWKLEEQAVAVKRIPAHLGMHWVMDAALAARAKLLQTAPTFDLSGVRAITLRVPPSPYVTCPFPATEHQARHSFQLTCCSALLDGGVGAASFSEPQIHRAALRELLAKVSVETPEDNKPNFDQMYCEVQIHTQQGQVHAARCDTFYGHWRTPLSQSHLEEKFSANAASVLSEEGVEGVMAVIENMERERDAAVLSSYLRMTSDERRRRQDAKVFL